MEVPSSSSGPSGSPSSGPAPIAAPDPVEREACRFLAAHVEPFLARDRRSALARTVRAAISEGRLAPLARLPERSRRDLLEAIEERIEASGRSPSPQAVVRLTSVISSTPVPDRGSGRRLAAPAR
ncbi:MAG: hypothetical protein L3J73_00765 [Thermoplasmata archaeon]|nr:hypothetical protein [Thermoplasmata archaeon]